MQNTWRRKERKEGNRSQDWWGQARHELVRASHFMQRKGKGRGTKRAKAVVWLVPFFLHIITHKFFFTVCAQITWTNVQNVLGLLCQGWNTHSNNVWYNYLLAQVSGVTLQLFGGARGVCDVSSVRWARTKLFERSQCTSITQYGLTTSACRGGGIWPNYMLYRYLCTVQSAYRG